MRCWPMPTASARNSSTQRSWKRKRFGPRRRGKTSSWSRKRAEFTRRERELEAAKAVLDTAQSKLESDKQTLKRRRDTLEREVAETSAALKEANAKLSEAEAERERISGLTRDEALAELRGQLEGRARALASKQVQEIESQVQKGADERARKVVASAIRPAGRWLCGRESHLGGEAALR